jgi:hypothetical protein
MVAATAALVALGFVALRSLRPNVAVRARGAVRAEEVRDAPAAVSRPLEANRVVEGNVARRLPLEPSREEPGSAISAVGRVRLRIVDGGSGLELERVRVRLASARRFAEHNGAAKCEVALTVGLWSAVVQADGFEEASLDLFEVAAGRTTDLGTIGLAVGSARVEGKVTAHHLEDVAAVELHLRGDGDAIHALSVTGSRRFRFDGLPAGRYLLCAVDPSSGIVAAERIELDRGGSAWCALDLPTPTAARFELRDEFGGPFRGCDLEPIHLEFRRGETLVGEVHLEAPREADAARGGAAEPTVQGASTPRDSLGPSHRDDPIDRERREGDELHVDGSAVEVTGAPLSIERLRADLFEVRPLPSTLITVTATCGELESEELPLDLRDGRDRRLVVTLRRASGDASLEERGGR